MSTIDDDDDDECDERRQSAEDDSIVRRIKMSEMKSKGMSVLSIDPQGAPCKEEE